MATRQRTRSSRKTPSSPALSGEQLASNAGEQRAQDSQVLRSSFDPAPFENGEVPPSSAADAPKATFVGEQLIYKDRNSRIAEAAYLRAERRGFATGFELEDWLAAEKEIDAWLLATGNSDSR